MLKALLLFRRVEAEKACCQWALLYVQTRLPTLYRLGVKVYGFKPQTHVRFRKSCQPTSAVCTLRLIHSFLFSFSSIASYGEGSVALGLHTLPRVLELPHHQVP